MNNVFDHIPHTSVELIKALDEQIGPVEVSTQLLSSQQGLLNIAYEAGQRQLITDLVNALKRQQEEAPNG